MSTARQPGRQRLLDAACRLFYEGGIQAVGIDAVIEAAGVAKMTLYRNFRSKDELVAAYLERRDGWWCGEVSRAVEKGRTPEERILGVFDALVEWISGPDFLGCAFIKASNENPGPEARRVIDRHKGWIRELLKLLACEAGAAQPEELTEQLFILMEGATVVASMEGRAEPALHARKAAGRLVQIAVSRSEHTRD